jgi:lipoprotein-anchoring transpeptidase ErfK/SrfK
MHTNTHIVVNIKQQMMQLFENDHCVREYLISTGKNGVGERINSQQTPRGKHIIRAKIGEGAVPNAVFIGRRQTGEIYHPELKQQYPTRDWILTRILWLSGCEVGKNRLGEVDTMRRYIYIHGAPDEVQMGQPGSHGCVRMRNSDVIELFEWVPVYCSVEIREE